MRLAAIFGRALVRIALLLAAIGATYLLLRNSYILAIGFVIALLAVVSVPYFNIVGHVQIAATDNSEYAKIRDRVHEDLIVAAELAESVTVVAHSQGGFIVHDLLSRVRAKGVDRFVGIGSGLKPITLLRHMQSTSDLILQWALLALVVLLEFALVYWGRIWHFSVGPDTPGYLFAVAGLNFMVSDTSMTSIQTAPFSEWFTLSTLGVAILLIGCLVGIRTVVNRLGGRSSLAIAPMKGNPLWLELSSNQDLVGRSLMPPAPTSCREMSLPVTAHPLIDHMRYFQKGGLAPRIVAHDLANDLGRTPSVNFSYVAIEGERRLRRAVRLRLWLILSLIVTSILPMIGEGGLTEDHALIVGLIVFALVMLITSPLLVAWQVWSSARINNQARRGRLEPTELPAEPQLLSQMLAVGLVIFTGILTCASGFTLEHAGLPWTEPMSSLGVLTLVIGILVGVGYWNHWMLLSCLWILTYFYQVLAVPPLIVSLPYPLGQGGFVLSVWCVISLAILAISRIERVAAFTSEVAWAVLTRLKLL